MYSTFINLNFEKYRELTKDQKYKLRSAETTEAERPKPWISINRNISRYAKYWLDKEDSKHISILGDFGAGKTSFSRYFAYQCAKNHLENPIRYTRIPLLIRLGNFSRLEKGGVQAMITDFLVNECNVNVNYAAFMKFIKSGKLLLILDGFDEMSMQVDEKTRIRNFEFLYELSTGNNKVILTGRPGYFPEFSDIKELMGRAPESDNIYEQVGNNYSSDEKRKKPNYEILRLKPFSYRQIKRFIQKQSKRLIDVEKLDIDSSTLTQTINNTYNLSDLAKRPVLLEIIIKTIPRIKEKIEDLNIFELYETYTNLWLKREWDKGDMRRLLTSKQRRWFMEELALEMYRENIVSIHYKNLQNRIKSSFPIEKDSMLDYFEHDVRTCTFLNRTDDGYYKFIHKSFLEYFTATRIIQSVKERDNSIIKSQEISEEVLGFVKMMMEAKDYETLLNWLISVESNTIQKQNALNILSQKGDEFLTGIDFSKVIFDGVKFSECEFNNCIFDKASFNSSLFKEVKFVDCSLKRVNLSNVKFDGYYFWEASTLTFNNPIGFVNCDLSYAELANEYYEDISFDQVRFYKTDLSKAKFNRCIFNSCKFTRVNMHKAILLKSKFKGSHFVNSYLRKAKFIPYVRTHNESKRLRDTSNVFDRVWLLGCNLKEVNVRYQLMRSIVFRNCNLNKATFIKSMFVCTEFNDTSLNNVLIVGSSFLKSKVNETLLKNAICQRINI